MTATDELRRLLDERGVEYEDKHTELVPGISDWDSTWWRGIAGLEFHAVGDETFGREGCVYINGTYLTPEQAIAATLGEQPAKLTAEEVRMYLKAMALDLQSPNPFKSLDEKQAIVEKYAHEIAELGSDDRMAEG